MTDAARKDDHQAPAAVEYLGRVWDPTETPEGAKLAAQLAGGAS